MVRIGDDGMTSLCRYGRNGFTLIELLISLVIFGIIIAGIQQILSAAIAAQGSIGPKQNTLAAARFAMERMVPFVRECDSIVNPVSTTAEETLKVSERVLDTYNNATHAYAAAGNGLLDADNDADGLINEDVNAPPDPYDYVTFYLERADGGNWKLMEQLPKYSTADTTDYDTPQVLCEHVTLFNCTLLAPGLVEIQLTVSDAANQVSLRTRARMR